MLTLMLAAGMTYAGPLSTCIPIEKPIDARPWRATEVDLSGEPNGEDAFAILEERVDAACRNECTTTSVCTPTECTTAAGDTVWWTYNESEYASSPSSDHEGILEVTVIPASSAGLPWSMAILRRVETRGSGGRAWFTGVHWEVVWGGSLHPLWPDNYAFTQRGSHGDELDGWFRWVAWADASCAWEARSNWASDSVTIGDTTVWIPDPSEEAVCRDSHTGYVPSYINREFAGLVYDTTWEMPTGPDADGDHWLATLGDCDDTRADVHCNQWEGTHDGTDQDCNGVDGVDHDGDGAYSPHPAEEPTPTEDCDDDDRHVYPGAPEVLGNGVDENCDGVDGYAVVDADTAADAESATTSDSEGGCSHAPRAPTPIILLLATALLTRRVRRNA